MTGIYHNSTPIGIHTKTYPDGKVEEIKINWNKNCIYFKIYIIDNCLEYKK
jgi:hypothetical protein